ncbi:NAD(P)-binding protein [Astrocystis sublimbata]|nr:NAD(P)-binding protein [Astrocystis sublimbata]
MEESRGSLARVVRHLETLPFELIEPILQELQFLPTLNLLILAPAGSRLRETIISRSRWPHILGGETEDLEYVWRSINQCALALYNRTWLQLVARRIVPGRRGDLENVAAPLNITKDSLVSRLWFELRETILYVLLGLQHVEGTWVAKWELQTLFHYLPADSIIGGWAVPHTRPGENEPGDGFVENLIRRIEECGRTLDVPKIISELESAYFRLFREQSNELNTLADLYERFPRFLKVADAPELPANEQHVLARLRLDARRRRRIPGWNRKRVVWFDWNEKVERKKPRSPYRFRFPHPTLVPFEWCLRLFKVVSEGENGLEIEERIPLDLKTHFKRAREGVDFIYCHTPGKRLKRTCGDTAQEATFAQYPFSNGLLPKPKAEIEWLEAFVIVVEWMTKEFPEVTRSVAAAQLPILRRRLLADKEDYLLFVKHESPRVIARQLRADLDVCRADSSTGLPSLLALYLPPWPSPRATEIARRLAPHRQCNHALLQLLYESKISEISAFLKGAPVRKEPEDGRFIVTDEIIRGNTDLSLETPRNPADKTRHVQGQPNVSEQDLVTTANTLRQLFSEMNLSAGTTGSELLTHILAQVETSIEKQEAQMNAPWETTVKELVASRAENIALRDCYICGREITKPHPIISSMCPPCGNFNLAGSRLSLPPRLSLSGKVAAVTGARVNLGYHVVLRLLRCGARVVASTRYPHDALTRYQAENDSAEWIDRLAIVGADFRSARDAFELAREIHCVVQRWGGVLHILVNNAAQTLTDSIEKEASSVKREERLESSAQPSHLLPATSYRPKVRAGNMARIEGLTPRQLTMETQATGDSAALGSSWVQSLDDIPYEDVISAHSVNAFVPLILVRELLPIMPTFTSASASESTATSASDLNNGNNNSSRTRNKKRNKASSSSSPSSSEKHARGYIINVSSREGIFEQTVRGARSAKNGKHVHTNMSKAALNMITETEAAGAWRTGRIAMNTVDPGYMSTAPELESVTAQGGGLPIGWEDGAGRLLWPVAVGELEKVGEEGCRAVWGRFLKHYGASRANLQRGSR